MNKNTEPVIGKEIDEKLLDACFRVKSIIEEAGFNSDHWLIEMKGNQIKLSADYDEKAAGPVTSQKQRQ